MMKQILSIILLAANFSFAQTPTFYGEDVERYKGLRLKVISSTEPYSFFILDKNRPWNSPTNTYQPGKQELTSDPDKILGKEFTVTDVIDYPLEEGKFLLELNDMSNNQRIYYYYDSSDKTHFAMQVMRDAAGNPIGMKVIEEAPTISSEADLKDFCSQIEVTKDKFTGAISSHNPFTSRFNILIYKDVTKSKVVSYSLALYTTGSTVSSGERGVFILLDNKARINRPLVEIDVEARQYDTHGFGDFEYSAYIKLTPAERALLLKHKITDFRLYIYDQEVDAGEGERIREYLKCLTTPK